CRALCQRTLRAGAGTRLLAGDAARQGIQPLRRGGDHGARRQDASRHGRDRQPGEGRRGTGDPEPEPRARLARGLGPARAREPVVSEVGGSLRTGAAGGAGISVGALVVKLGGRALEAPGALRECAVALREAASTGGAPRPTLVVHGGGAEVTAWCERLGLAARFADGLRVTDPATLQGAAGVLAGLANKRLVAALRAEDVDAVGLAALDGGIARARRHPNAAVLGEVGEIAAVDAGLLMSLLDAGRVPVLASLSDDGKGALLNLNADDVAAGVAAALPARDLLLFSDTPGLVLEGERVESLDATA